MALPRASALIQGASVFDSFKEDIAAFRAHDPAATSTISIVLNSPGMRAIWAYRRQHWLWEHGHPLLARTLSTWSRHRFGVEIHPGAKIGRRFIIDHGNGIVVGETTVIGDDCMLYQGVTLGGTGKETGKRHPTLEDRRFIIDHGNGIVVGETTVIGDDCMLYQGVTLGGTGKETGKRHPTLEDNVTVGVGAAVLGNVTLGKGSKVGGGAVVVKDVPPDCTVVGIPGHITTRCGVRVRRAAEPYRTSARLDSMPDPVQQTMDILEARIAQLEAEVERLSAARPAPGEPVLSSGETPLDSNPATAEE